MGKQPNDDAPDPDALERLIEDARHGRAVPASPIAGLLAAATASDEARVRAGEEAALAAFRAAGQDVAEGEAEAGAGAETPGRRLTRWRYAVAPVALATAALAIAVLAVLGDTGAAQRPDPSQSAAAPGTAQPGTHAAGDSQLPPAMDDSAAPYLDAASPPAVTSTCATPSQRTKPNGDARNPAHGKHAVYAC